MLSIQNIKKKLLNSTKKSYIKKKRNIDNFRNIKINKNKNFLLYINYRKNYNNPNIVSKKNNRFNSAILLQISEIYILNERDNPVIFFIIKQIVFLNILFI